jgi:hypothetical protein
MKCPTCNIEFDEKTGRRPKKFCSDKCKVKFWNGQKRVAEILKAIGDVESHQTTQTWVDQNLNDIPKSQEPPKSTAVTVSLKDPSIQAQIDTLTAELTAIVGDSQLAQIMKNKIRDKITKLKRQL